MFSYVAKEQFIKKNGPSLTFFKNTDINVLHNAIKRKFPKIVYKTQPREYQYRSLYAALIAKRCILFLGPRLGKTKISLDYITNLSQKNKLKFLIVVPSDSIISVWLEETKIHSDLKALGVYGNTQERKRLLDMSDSYDLTVIPYSGIQSIFSKKTVGSTTKNKRVPDMEAINRIKNKFDGIIIDEIHHCKDSRTLRFKIMRMMTQGKEYRLGLTGTPFSRDAFALWPQFYLIDEGETLSKNEMFFRDAFGKQVCESGFTKTVFDEKKINILSIKSSTRSISYTTYEGLGVSTFPSNIVNLGMSPPQEKAYWKLLSQRGEDVVNIYMKLRQISSGFLNWVNPETGAVSTIDICHGFNPKLDWLQSELYETSDRVIIYYDFTYSGHQISSLLTKNGIKHRWVHGGCKDKVKAIQEYRDGTVNVILFQSLTGAEGLDLHNSNRQIFYETTDKGITRMQIDYRGVSVKRTCPLIVDDLVTSPIEKKILEYLKQGKDILKEIIFDPSLLEK